MTRLLDTMLLLAYEAGEEAGDAAAAAQDASQGAPPPGNPLFGLIPFILIIVVFFWLMSRSQKKRERQRQEMLDSIKPKDDVMTIGGIRGRVVQIKGDEVVVRIDPDKDIKITMARSGISRKLGDEEQADKT